MATLSMYCVSRGSAVLVTWLSDGCHRLMRVLGSIAIEKLVTVIVEGLTSEMGVLGALQNFLLDLGHWHGPDLLAESVRHELLWNGLHSVHSVHQDMGPKLAHHLLHDLFQSCNTFQQRDVRGLFLPHQRRRRYLIFGMEEETAPTSEVGTGRPLPAWRHRKKVAAV